MTTTSGTIGSGTAITEIITTITVTLLSLILPKETGEVTANMMSKMLQFSRFISLPFSSRLYSVYTEEKLTSQIFGIHIEMNSSVEDLFTTTEMPTMYQIFDLQSSFFLNYWGTFAFLLATFILFSIISGLETIMNKFSKTKHSAISLQKSREHIQNFLLIQFYNTYGEIIFLFIIEAKIADYQVLATLLSLLLAFCLILLGLFIFYKHITLIRKYQMLKKQTGNFGELFTKFLTESNGVQVLIENFKDVSFSRQGYLLIFVLRSAVFNMILGLSSDSPVAQSTLTMCLSIAMLVYLLITRPYKSIINFIEQVLCELIFLSCSICLLIMSTLDVDNVDVYNTIVNLGEALVVCSVFFSFIPLLFIIIKISNAILGCAKKNKKVQTTPIHAETSVQNQVQIEVDPEIAKIEQQFQLHAKQCGITSFVEQVYPISREISTPSIPKNESYVPGPFPKNEGLQLTSISKSESAQCSETPPKRQYSIPIHPPILRLESFLESPIIGAESLWPNWDARGAVLKNRTREVVRTELSPIDKLALGLEDHEQDYLARQIDKIMCIPEEPALNHLDSNLDLSRGNISSSFLLGANEGMYPRGNFLGHVENPERAGLTFR